MTSRWKWLFGLLTRRLWFRATLISLLAVASALISIVVAPFLPEGLSAKIGADAVDSILTIIASSMLAVTTFSLSTTVAAYSAATSHVTPRATKLLIEDATTQNVLATFVGSFLFSLVAIITLSMGAYGERGRVVLFVVTIAVVLLIVVTLLRWIDYLLRLGRVGETTEQVEKAAERAFASRLENPYLGGTPLMQHNSIPVGAVPVLPVNVGYVQNVDVAAISAIAERCEGEVFLTAIPGTLVDFNRPLAWCACFGEEVPIEDLQQAFTVANERTYDQDPRFGLSVLAEIASRALSPAMNDPGTAIDVIGRSVRLLSTWAADRDTAEIRHPRVKVPEISPGELLDDIYHPIARDGATMAEVHVRLQKALLSLARMGEPRFRTEAVRHSRLAMKRAELAMTFQPDVDRVRQAAQPFETL